MLSVSVRNLDKFVESCDRWLEKTTDTVMHVANGITVELFEQVLETSPQFSGDFAANWQYSINQVNTTFTELNLQDDPDQGSFSAGDRTAINYAKVMNKGRDSSYRLGDTFFVSNSAKHDEPYAILIENNQINFRRWAGNRGETINHAVRTVMPRYDHISPMQARRLARKKL